MNFLSRLFKSAPKLEPIDLSLIGTDMHSHLIPGIDDGSKSLEDTMIMLKKFSDLGYKKVITTPHIMSDYYRNTPEIILGGLEKVRAAIKEEGIAIELEAAAEYYLDYSMRELIASKQILTFGDNYVLVELSFSQEQPGVKQLLFELITEGYNPILAHVERYPYYNNQWNLIEEYRERGILLQLNLNSLSGHYGPMVKRMAELLIDRDCINVIGSDCHHFGHLEMIETLRTNPHLHKIVNKPNLLNKTL